MWLSSKQQLIYNWLWFLSNRCAYKGMFAKGEKPNQKIFLNVMKFLWILNLKINEVETMLHFGDI